MLFVTGEEKGKHDKSLTEKREFWIAHSTILGGGKKAT